MHATLTRVVLALALVSGLVSIDAPALVAQTRVTSLEDLRRELATGDLITIVPKVGAPVAGRLTRLGRSTSISDAWTRARGSARAPRTSRSRSRPFGRSSVPATPPKRRDDRGGDRSRRRRCAVRPGAARRSQRGRRVGRPLHRCDGDQRRHWRADRLGHRCGAFETALQVRRGARSENESARATGLFTRSRHRHSWCHSRLIRGASPLGLPVHALSRAASPARSGRVARSPCSLALWNER